MRMLCTVLLVAVLAAGAMAEGEDVFDKVDHHYADSDGVKIHYVTIGQGPALLFVHGFPDFWYSWRHQMEGLSNEYKCVAMDMRGYNKSDKPEGVDNYTMDFLLADVEAVIKDLGVEKVILVGHDWGGAISWRFAMTHPEKVDKLIICNLTHPKGYMSVLANASDEQRKNTDYARSFASSKWGEGPKNGVMFARFAAGPDEAAQARYKVAMENSDYDAMVSYYRANYGSATGSAAIEIPNIACPVLQFHGLLDKAVDKDGLIRTWEWVDKDYTLVTLPDVDHWVQRDGAETVTTTMKWWLNSRR